MDSNRPRVPAPCGGNVGAAQPKAQGAGAPRTPPVPPPCGGNVGAAQPKTAASARAPQGPAPCGGNVGAGAAQAKKGAYAVSTQASGGAHKVVARADGHAVGSVEVRSGGGAMELVNLSVDAAHRQNGVGKQLIAQALQAGMSGGNAVVKLESQDDGSGRLTRWYESMGFTRVGTSERRLAVMQAPASTVRAASARGKDSEGK